MLPLQQALEVKQSILEYLKATFDFKEKSVYKAFYRFIEDPKEGIFKGPYVSLKLPFESYQGSDEIPLEIKPNFNPYKHQFEAFARLHTENDHRPQPTLLTTGTGSGKTEAFLYPILDYCYKHWKERGIKVIILYPMNALATDQAKRMAEVINQDERLKGNITAGLFIGEGKDRQEFQKKMGEDHVIESRDEIIAHPPDILLTNFKMLDYGLLRHQYHKLWTHNFDNPELLRFLVLDELHTYDGAQGTDVANLIRRLKLKLDVPKKHLCPIGTSATLGSGDDSVKLLTEYASDVFGESFSTESVITEHRQDPDQFLNNSNIELDPFIPRIVGLKQSQLGMNENYEDYIGRQKVLWQLPMDVTPFQLSRELKKLQIVKDIIAACSNEIITLSELITRLDGINQGFRQLPEELEDSRFKPKEELLASLLALIADAKFDKKGRFPFLFLQIQFWVRELSGLLREVNKKPVFSWRDKVTSKDENVALPPYFCRECGASGWLAVKHDNRNQFEKDPVEVYEHYFSNHKNIYLVNLNKEEHYAVDEYNPSNTLSTFVHGSDLRHHDHPETERIYMLAYRKVLKQRSQHICPECNTENTINIIGTRVATLNSISISQVLSSDLDERSEKYRKVLAFTNGVQDAAHQAGFVQARNYRFTFRASLQKLINQIGNPVDLSSLAKEFIDYWKTNADPAYINHLEAYYYRFFPSDYIGKAELEEYRSKETGVFPAAFGKEFDLRIYWEILSEFGYNAAIGRTLEKTGSSAVSFKEDDLRQTFDSMREWMRLNKLESIEGDEFLRFVNGILHRIRIRGAVDHDYLSKFRSGDLKLRDLSWLNDSRHFLNRKYHPRSRIPKLVCTNAHTRGVLDTTFARTSNWFHTYFVKSFPLVPNYAALLNEFYEELFNQLTQVGLLNIAESKDGPNYAISPDRIIVSNQVTAYNCSKCSHTLSVAKGDNTVEDSLCLDYRCTGKHKQTNENRLNYYNLIYNRSKTPRIYAAEHTGVLDRSVREATEISFKERPSYNSLNTLVATSTLEMGIDVGTLNTAINTSVPPLTSNFLQRIGRAGRSSGSALIENFAQNKSHDLFYFAEPLEMMDGDINTPGCFLNAKDILARHFTAYCFDSWAKEDPQKNQIPGLVRTLNLMSTKTTDSTFFINRFLEFVLDNQKELFLSFFEAYDGQVEETIIESIKTSVKQGAFQQKLILAFDKLRDELFFLLNMEKDIDVYVKEKNLGSEDDERKALEQERKTLGILRKKIESRFVIEHLTNEGILPNYAFPETGVKLYAHVFGFKPEGAEQEPLEKSFEIVRSAATALREYAPDNFFYSQGNKFEITGINTFDWVGERSSMTTLRFCSNCDHLAEDINIEKGACPKCGHPSWNSSSNRHQFARLYSVKSVNTRNKSALSDSKDERDQNRYVVSTHFKFNPKRIEGTWGMVKIPFGIEYVKEVELIKVNLGAGVPHSSHITINQVEDIARHGFVTCRHCGKSTSKPADVLKFDNKKFHYGYCKFREQDYKGAPDDIFEEVFLYRFLQTEAIKILLPVQEFLNEATQHMFKAGLELGLKRYYKGNPDHISFEFYSEYNIANERFDRYLVAYDLIPGGTGYLQKLFDPVEFTQLLEEAYNSIKNCSCKSQGKDGCYRCILSYANQYIREDLSRERAEELFGRIVRASKEWEAISQGISSLTKTGIIEESELELKFRYALEKSILSKEDADYSFEEVSEDGRKAYRIGLPIEEGKVNYILRPQVNLGERDGIAEDTRSDFYFKCIEVVRHGEVITDVDELTAFKDVAIYLDGYTYHASEKHMRFYNDIAIRDSIAESPNITSWSLSWSDMVLFEAEKEEDRADELFPSRNRYGESIKKLKNLPISSSLNLGLLNTKNSVDRLLWYLCNSNNPNLNSEMGHLFASFQERFGSFIVDKENAQKILSEEVDLSTIEKSQPDGESYMKSNLTIANELYKTRVLVRIKDLQVMSQIHIAELSNIDKAIWEEFLRIYSLIRLM